MKKFISLVWMVGLYCLSILLIFIAVSETLGATSWGKATTVTMIMAWTGGNMFCRFVGKTTTFMGSQILSIIGMACVAGSALDSIPKSLLTFDGFIADMFKTFGGHLQEGLLARIIVVAASGMLVFGMNFLIDQIGKQLSIRINGWSRFTSGATLAGALCLLSMQLQGKTFPVMQTAVTPTVQPRYDTSASLLPEMDATQTGEIQDVDDVLKKTWEAEKKNRKTQSVKLAPGQSHGPGAELFPLPVE